MKNLYLILCAGLIMFLSFSAGRSFYRANVDTMRSQAEIAFIHVLKQELEKKNRSLKISYTTYNKTGVDTIPLHVHITTVSGKRKYKVNAEKSKKNLSQNFTERSLQSIYLKNSPLSVDALWKSWQDTLRDYRIYGTIVVKIFTTDLEGCLNCVEKSGLSPEAVPNQITFVSYIGNRCEVEIIGKLQYTWWSVCLYHWPPFLGNIVITLIIFVFLFCLFRLKDGVSQVVLVSASQRIYNVFDAVGFSIKFVRVGTDRYTMVFIDNQ